MDDSSKNGSRRRDGWSGSPFPSFFLLIVAFVALISFLVIIGEKGKKAHKMSQSAFERCVVAGEIKDVTLYADPTEGKMYVHGEYTPDGAADPTKYEVEIVWSDRFDALLTDSGVDWVKETKNNAFMRFFLSSLPFILLIIFAWWFFSKQLKGAGKGAMQFGKSRAKLNQSTERVTFSDVAGVEEALEDVSEIAEYLRDPQKFHKLGGRLPRGVLMVGPPGTGKTLLARAIAGEADVPFFSISGSDFVEMFVGVGASRVRDMFETAKKNAPCIIFIDEIDAVGRSRFSGLGGGHDEREQTLNALLVEMDGFENNTGVIVVAATNRPDVLDPALLRPGRFDRQINVDLPDVKGREGILKVHSKKVKMSDRVDLAVVARGTPGFSGADLANIINEAALLAARQDKEAVEMMHLEEARDKVCWGKERRSREVDERDRQVTAYHEAGHALLCLYCEHATPLHKVTIIPRGNSFLGATIHFPDRDKYTQTRSEMIDELTVLMGGRFAEQLIFNEITSGAAMDIRQATQIARRMVCQFGMSDKMGMLAYDSAQEPVFVGRDMGRSSELSEATAREIDIEVKAIVDSVAARARKLLSEHQDQLEALGKALLQNETMDVVEIRGLLGIKSKDEVDRRLVDDAPETDETPEEAETAEEKTLVASTGEEAGNEEAGNEEQDKPETA